MKKQEPSFEDRLSESTKAKRALLEKARERKPANDPNFAAKQAARAAATEQRRARAAERKALAQIEKTRKAEKKAAEETAREQAREAERQAREQEAAEEAARKVALLAEQKAARDRRYAARKARR